MKEQVGSGVLSYIIELLDLSPMHDQDISMVEPDLEHNTATLHGLSALDFGFGLGPFLGFLSERHDSTRAQG